MQYIHQSTYGHAGGVHTARPIMAVHNGSVYNMVNGRPDFNKPMFVQRGNHLFSTEHHPDGASPHALYEIKGDKIHTTAFNPAHNPSAHLYELRPGPATA